MITGTEVLAIRKSNRMSRRLVMMGIILLTLLMFCFTSLMAQDTYDDKVETYINKYQELAIEEMIRTGIPASITLAQGIIESGAGESSLATKANNHFGIKCHDTWNGKTYKFDDDKKNECFRKYKSAEESFYDHSDFLVNRTRYAVLFTYDTDDYKKWAKGLKQCGYATNPKYADLLINCIENYDLHQWDMDEKERSDWFAEINDSKRDSPTASNDNDPLIESDEELLKNAERVFIFNDIKTVTLQEGESLNDIGTAYWIGISRLMRYNDITDPSQLTAGDPVYLQPKRRNGAEEFHFVKPGETMFSISKQHGVQLLMLYQKNLMPSGSQPSGGDTIYLRNNRKIPPASLKIIPPPLPEEEIIPEVEIIEPQYHMIVKGDTLYSLSKKYNLPVAELKELNGLQSDHLTIGAKLKLAQ